MAVGAPCSAPFADDRLRPDGSSPAEILNVYGPVPPRAEKNVWKAAPPVIGLSVFGSSCSGRASISTLYATVASDRFGCALSLTVTEKSYWPAAVGVPWIAPLDSNCTPGGNAPALNWNAYGGKPPSAVSGWL